MKVFLGGTCNDSFWRTKLIRKLKIDYFNPVVEDWTPECQIEELKQREICDFLLYVITPKMTGVYSIAEVVDDSNKYPEKTIFCVLEEDSYCDIVPENEKIEPITLKKSDLAIPKFTDSQLKSLNAVAKLVERNGGKHFNDLDLVANYLNAKNHLLYKNVLKSKVDDIYQTIYNLEELSADGFNQINLELKFLNRMIDNVFEKMKIK